MKKTLFIALLLSSFGMYAQEDMSEDQADAADREEIPYKQWSFDVGVGVHKPSRNLSPGYYTNTPDFWQADLGIRYMINEYFGLNLDLGYNNITSADESLDFESRYLRSSLEGVLNFGSLVGFRQWTDRLNILVHGGMGVSALQPQEPIEQDETDLMLNFTVGVTPQIKLSDAIVLFGDLSIFGHVRQDYTFDGVGEVESIRGFNGFMVNASVGLSIYLGEEEVHADWYRNDFQTQLDEMEKRVAKIETDNADDDQDGVPNYLDRDNTTEAGVAVDRKGRAIDTNKNGIPDEMEPALERQYASKDEVKQMVDNSSASRSGDGNAIYKLLNDGYVNVYFKFNSTQPATYSLEAINYLVTYMKENPTANAELIGYADEMGGTEYNMQLSERRANMVKDVLVASGIDESRLAARGAGEDDSVSKDSSQARQLVRRVTFKLK
jgi:OOP family OmpA-OmpF porin